MRTMISSLIRGARYWPETQALELCLVGGRRYLYLGVPQRLADEFQRARSKGNFFNLRIKGRFDCHPLRDEGNRRCQLQAANE
ncbi:KTSC domain-containing protein [Sphingomonas arenae]|uniref:KTSC domain-containing protein n=1 Tax=Sphingomonas arenae TaxID=2812555 RepID=UPI0019672A88|nr:KTSC domain-containing protein [Sphingomonas arenae]